ncbi:unnamed protein product, partial [marine sediment metagenome]
EEQNSALRDTSNSENLIEVIDFISKKDNLCFDKPYFSIGNILVKLISLYKWNNLFDAFEEPHIKDYCSHGSNNTVIGINQSIENYIKNISIASFCAIQLDTFSRRLKTEELKNLGFHLENPNEITSFLSNNPKIRHALEETNYYVAKYFKEFELHLSLYVDYEEEYEVLNIIVYSNLPTDKLVECENLLFDNWFEKYYTEFTGKLTIRVYPI